MKAYFLWLAKLLTLLVLIFFVIPLLLIAAAAGGGKAFEEGLDDSAGKPNAVAVVEVNGGIESSKDTVKDLYKVVDNDKFKAVVLRVNSPGGAVAPSQEIYETVKALKERKPIVASMSTLAASGGLYSSLSASKIFAEPGTITGSIGVIMQLPNFRRIADLVGVEMVTIKSGELKDIGNSFREMTPAEREFLQSTINTAYGQFVQAVSESRGIDKNEVMKFADGRPILGSDAKNLHLIDEFGGVYEAARAALELAHVTLAKDEQPNLVYQKDRLGMLKKFIDSVTALPELFSERMELKYILQ
jgi:protease-4